MRLNSKYFFLYIIQLQCSIIIIFLQIDDTNQIYVRIFLKVGRKDAMHVNMIL